MRNPIASLWSQLVAVANNPLVAYKLHYVAAVAWLALMWPTTTTWKDSVLWVGLISCYANFISHWGTGAGYSAKMVAGRAEAETKRVAALVAAQNKEMQKDQTETLDEMREVMDHLDDRTD
jgi:hypothetical protein